MVFPIILGSGTPKPTPTTNKHTCTTKKNTQKGRPLPIWGRFPPLRFLFLLRHSWRHQPSHNINPGLWAPFAVAFLNFNRADRQVCPGFCRFGFAWWTLYPPLNASSFQWERGSARRWRRTPGQHCSMAQLLDTEGGVKFFTESTAAKLKGSRICV